MSIVSITASSRLASIVGPAHVISDSLELAAYEIDGKKPSSVVRPGSAEEVAEIVRFAAAEKLCILACGARTKLSMGMPPRQYDLALDLTRLGRITAYDPGDLTLAVEPGVPLQKIEEVLAEHKQWLPLAVPYMGQSTAGGAIASGVDSALRQMYGTVRDFVLGMEFVTGEGIAAKSGGRVVKNVTGYDMHKLMIGALGTLGVITKINLRTYPVPISTRGFTANFHTAAQALELRQRIARSPLTPLSLEILSPHAATLFSSEATNRLLPRLLPTNLLSSEHWTLAAEFSGNEKVLARCEWEFQQLSQQCGCATSAALTGDALLGVAARKREFVAIALTSSPATTIMKMSVLPARMNELLAKAAKAAETNSLPWAAMARGLGIIYFALLPADRSDQMHRRVIQTLDQILRDCLLMVGNATIPWSPTEWKTTLKVWGLERGDLDQMRKLKNIFDPQAILSPGRFLGGI
jgi:glycolate oxidase FAD binding subunit